MGKFPQKRRDPEPPAGDAKRRRRSTHAGGYAIPSLRMSTRLRAARGKMCTSDSAFETRNSSDDSSMEAKSNAGITRRPAPCAEHDSTRVGGRVHALVKGRRSRRDYLRA